ncbi:MAG: lipopolysaccharide biosynthesis protein [Kordia sp.]|uniref:lipopolysaccharide biosynthesis protein n=1 Tax=Kordia sp. TaxID=1965332 RepID=UPI00385CE5D8
MRRLLTIGINTIQGFANPAFNFLIVVFGVKIFGKTEWASLINVMIWVFFISFIFGWGNRDHLLRAYSKNPSKMYDAFFSNLLSRSLLVPFSAIFLFFFPAPIALWAIVLICLQFLYNSLSTLVIYHQKFGTQLIAEIIGFGIIFGSIFYFKTFHLERFLQIYVIATFIKLIALSVQLKFWKESFSAKVSLHEFKVGLPFFILGLSGWLASKIDIYTVDFHLEKSQLAEYQLLITAFLMLQALAAYITIPFTKHIYRLPAKVVQKIKYKLYAVSIPLTILGGFTIWFIMEYLVKLGFSYEYYIVGGFIALPCYFYSLNIMELMKNHQERAIIYISFFTFFVNISLILLLIETYEIFGVLLSVAISQWVVLLVYKLHWKFS